MMVSHISILFINMFSYVSVNVSQSGTESSRLWTDWPQSVNHRSDLGGEGLESESEECSLFVFVVKPIQLKTAVIGVMSAWGKLFSVALFKRHLVVREQD